ncbi:hypothetical protein [Arthrobacter sp. NPDC090010]|uniref:hypothetical protein n=1 Tax=Arthrobacter sp. NPDC090010 TaxID=3363942 RepID=UPI003828F8A0
MSSEAATGHAAPGARNARQELAQVRGLLRGSGSQDRWYPWYLAALLAGFVLAPGWWSVVLLVSPLLAGVPMEGAGALTGVLEAFLVVAAAFSPRYLGPVWTSAEEIHYLVAGPFGIGATLRARTLFLRMAIVAGALVLGFLPSVAWWQGNGRPDGATPFLVAAVLGLLGGLGAALLASWKQTRRGGLDVPRLEELTTIRDTALAGVLIGDGRALAGAVPRRGPRTARRLPRGLLRRAVAIDLRYARQDPWRVLLSVALLVAVTVLASLWSAGPAGLAVVLLAAQAAMGRLSGALGDISDTVGFDVVVPQSAASRLLAQLLFPAAVVLLATALPAVIAAPGQAWGFLAMAAGAILLRCATLGVAGLPAQFLTPVSTPVGDATAMFMVLWLLRPVIPAVWVLWAGGTFALSSVTGTLLVVLGVLALVRFGALARQV